MSALSQNSLVKIGDFWEAMDHLGEQQIRNVELELAKTLIREFQIDIRCLLYDATNFFTWIATTTEAEFPQRGHNKQKRVDLPWEFHIPLFHQVYEGNRTDAKEFARVTEELVDLYRCAGH